jgi:sec-independent protein translocase protein TatA
MSFGPTELIIILVIVLLIFGVGRVSKIGGELGSAVSNFRKGLDDGNKKNAADGATPVETPVTTPNEPK